MGSEYDRKFEEMKKYIPFLESMINRLEANSSASANPRQAQLDKIRSLRDLLLDKKKRMKMENLLKCEQVLVNLYNKVEQRDAFADLKPVVVESPKTKEKNNLEIVRNKLKMVAKLQEDADTLPEIARASDVEQICTPGSKEPALFQRRPNLPGYKASKSNMFENQSRSPQMQSKRGYTRILVSPERRERSPPRRWSSPEKANNKPSRRSPATSKSPLPSKKEKKKSKSSKKKTKGLNFTLKVPEESLDSINTEDILSRILTCSDGDVDIGTLRELRSQILNELKDTGTNNDISDLILKSYNKKTNKKAKHKRLEVEDGEISDSESEAIGNIYGSLVMVNDDKNTSAEKVVEDENNGPRKIQIRLVIDDKRSVLTSQKSIDISEFEIQSESDGNTSFKEVISIDSDTSSSPLKKTGEASINQGTSHISVESSPSKENMIMSSPVKKQLSESKVISSPVKIQENVVVTIEENENENNKVSVLEQSPKVTERTSINSSEDAIEPNVKEVNDKNMVLSTPKKDNDNSISHSTPKKNESPSPVKTDTYRTLVDDSASCSEVDAEQNKSIEKVDHNLEKPTKFIANFYKPLEELHDPSEKLDEDHILGKDTTTDNTSKLLSPISVEHSNIIQNKCTDTEKDTGSTQIPLLNEPSLPPVANKDVRSDIDILEALKNEILGNITVPISEPVPPLHQPKLTKVANALDVAPKKRISIEKYKAKSKESAKPLFVKHHLSRDEHKKQSLMLTEKECERFNFPKRVSLDDDDISDDDLLNMNSVEDESSVLDNIYGDLAPKSPDNDISRENSTPPVIIPVEPVKTTTTVSSKSDVDMRKIVPLLSPSQPVPTAIIPPSPSYNIDKRLSSETGVDTKKGSERPSFSSKDPRVRRDLNSVVRDSPNPHSSLNPDRTPRSAAFPNMTPSYMPSVTPSMTPNARSYEMTPTHASFEMDNFSNRKHVYAPSFSAGENRERELSASRDNWDSNTNDPISGRRSRWERDSHKLDPPVTPRYEDSHNNRSRNHDDQFYRDKRDGYSRAECPTTPIPSFGWSDCPSTPSSSFGRQDPPMTPSHPFGRSEYPGTPSHPFGRSECPSTPVHPFGRNDGSQTPSHIFGRSEASSHGRHDGPHSSNTSKYNKDPRIYTRHRDYESSSYGEKDRNFEQEQSFNRGGSYRTHSKPYDRDRSQSYYSKEQNVRNYDRDRRESNESHMSRDHDNDRLYTRNRSDRYDGRQSRDDDVDSRRHQREKSIGRMTEYNPTRELSERAQSVSRPSLLQTPESVAKDRHKDSTLSFKSNTGRSLTINTSVKSTFQDFLDKPIQVFDYTFDARRQRASSVGRSLVRDNSGRTFSSGLTRGETSNDNDKQHDRFKRACSMGKELIKSNKREPSFKELKADFETFRSNLDNRRHDKFRRASSVGRELVREVRERSFKDIKADFESFKTKLNTCNIGKQSNIKAQTQDSNRSRKDIYKEQGRQSNQPSKQQYSPRKNYRDPRMRKESHTDYQSRYKIDRRGDYREKHNQGIVYSSDNIAKGTIMGSGFGVKNYKIPKIKRPPAEPEQIVTQEKNESNDKTETKTVKDVIEENLNIIKDQKVAQDGTIDKKLNQNKEATNLVEETVKTNEDKKIEVSKSTYITEDSEKRITRSKTKSVVHQLNDDDLVRRTRRSKKAVIHDSDSDSEKNIESNDKKVKTPIESPNKQISNKPEQVTSQKESADKTNVETLDSSFGIDDMEMFTENIGSDSVIDNINALIADLDHDIDTSKIEQMMESIDSPEGDSLCDISEVIENDLTKPIENAKEDLVPDKLSGQPATANIISTKPKPDKLAHSQSSDNKYSVNELMDILEVSGQKESNTETESSDICRIQIVKGSDSAHDNGSEAIVSTTEIGEVLKMSEERIEKTLTDDSQSVPDSTLNKNDEMKKSEQVVADSTNEIHCELSSDVSSTHDISETGKKEVEKSSSTQIDAASLNSIGNLLSILQDKAKIKELLTILGDKSSENEKIKKKLERLSEIVSDDNEDNDTKEDKIKITSLRKESCDTNYTEDSSKNDSYQNDEVKIEEDKQISLKCDEQNTANTDKITGKDKLEIDPAADNYKDKITSESPNADDTKKVTETNETINNSNVVLDDVKSVLAEGNDEKDDNNDGADDSNKIEDLEQEEKKEAISKIKRKFTKKIKAKKNMKKNVAKNKLKLVPATVPVKKTANRELKKLQDDIKEMFMSDDILNATGIRMCRLAKMVHGKEDDKKESSEDVSESILKLKKGKNVSGSDEALNKLRKKPGPKPKNKIIATTVKKAVKNVAEQKEKALEPDNQKINNKPKYLDHKSKPGPKSKTKQMGADTDPYEFDTDSITDTNTTKETDESSSEYETDSMASSLSIGSSEVLAEAKKKTKRKRFSWQSGVIKPKNKKKKGQKQPDTANQNKPLKTTPRPIPDFNCFTDKTYCFDKDVSSYQCRLCEYEGKEIVIHYRKQHPHTEIPLSRMNQQTAELAIKQCEEINFHVICKLSSKKYVCRFCHKEFGRNSLALEFFFWHVVSAHTGEYKDLCSECLNVTPCPFNLDIPPPPKDTKGQLIGYICAKCNFTQVSLENLKTHVIVRHNDEQTEVFTINLAKISKKTMNSMLSNNDSTESPRVLRNRSIRSNQSTTETSDNREDQSELESSERVSEADTMPLVAENPTKIIKPRIKPEALKSKLTFENDEPCDDLDTPIKMEQEEHEIDEQHDEHLDNTLTGLANNNPITETVIEAIPELTRNSDVIMDYPHFKLNHLTSGAKEYVCCINGNDNHYKTTLLISMKKHIQTKHSEKWDGFCCVCKVIVTLQGVQSDFRDCLSHLLDKHMDDFPILDKATETVNTENPSLPIPERITTPPARTASPGYLAVRPIAELISKELVKDTVSPPEEPIVPTIPIIPKIENVVSISESVALPLQCSPVYPYARTDVVPPPEKPFLYEEFQAEVMTKKHRVVLDAMMSKKKLVRVFKCAGRFCSFTSDSADSALVHASTHQRIGGDGALNCVYCNFDACENAIDLVMHVFKVHSQCQYSCSLCFYRAAAGQLVGAHHKKVHGSTSSIIVLRTMGTAVPPDLTNCDAMLTREQAVHYLICNHEDGNCNFKTFTAGKFIEHLIQKHADATTHPCHLCQEKLSSPQELTIHMKSHDINMYQCTWCVHGTDNEASLLSHVASCHPNRQPQAYIRVITNKDGSKQRRVLPLAFFNKSTVPQEDVSPIDDNENPVREAERSIELEKLIGLTSLMIENAASSQGSSAATDQTTRVPTESPIENSDTIEPRVAAELTSEQVPQETHVKTEPEEVTKRFAGSDIICLDSDDDENDAHDDPLPDALPEEHFAPSNTVNEEVNNITNEETNNADNETEGVSLKRIETPRSSVSEDVTITKISSDVPRTSISDDDSRHAVIELSDEESTRRPDRPPGVAPVVPPGGGVKVRPEVLLTCPKCKMLCKSNHGLRKHMNKCCGDIIELPCPHGPCPAVLTGFVQMIEHFNKEHVERDTYLCGVCELVFNSLSGSKLHVRAVHRGTPYVVSTRRTAGVGHVTTVGALPPKPAPAPAPPAVTPAPPTPRLRSDLKRYGVDDIDALPISPILDSAVQCELCVFSTKVRLNMVRHLQMHASRQPVPRTQPVNPVPHLETNEMHFDRMVNLASSSVGERAAAAPGRYPPHVPERRRFACGAADCSYISVDEATLRRHWEALHAGAASFRCVHCPPDQLLNSSKPLSAARIVAHLRMHEETLYACSACSYYHPKSRAVERHTNESHRGGARVLIVREEGTAPPPPAAAPPAPPPVPTMDLKPWRCGLCEFSSMLRPAVSEHCAQAHHSKMQFKCAYCPFRTSARENVVKHQTNSHPTRPEEILHYYYREGSLPDDVDGVPRWKKQRRLLGLPDLEIKEEPEPEPPAPAPATSTPAAAAVVVDLNLVKKEVDESPPGLSLEVLCKKYGSFCEPNGIQFRCCLCSSNTARTRDDMKAHLFEELNYRRLGCGLCSYKAFHKVGLDEHTAAEHPRQCVPPTELPVDRHIEAWVVAALDHQANIIQTNKQNFAAQAIQSDRPPPAVVTRNVEPSRSTATASDPELEHAFGNFGEPRGAQFSCPKCDYQTKDEMGMRNHLEIELTKIRWCCTECSSKYTTYHEVQNHCRNTHVNGGARPKEAIRDPNVRAMWVSAVITKQKQNLQSDPEPGSPERDVIEADNSLLVARYDEPVPIEPVQLIPTVVVPPTKPIANKRPAPVEDSDDDSRLVIDEPPKKKPTEKKCPHCDYTTTTHRCYREHIVLKHYNIKPYKCSLCSYSGQRMTVLNHIEKRHAGEIVHVITIPIPAHPPVRTTAKGTTYPSAADAKSKKPEPDDSTKKVCLYCEKSVPESDVDAHVHDNVKPQFGNRAEVVVKCLKCLELCLTVTGMQDHFASCHPDNDIAYAFFKLQVDLREIHCCGHCYRKFKNLGHLREHHTAMHLPLSMSYTSIPFNRNLRTECDNDTGKRKLEDGAAPSAKRTARKSTSKLPMSAVAKKSTTKLPLFVPDTDEFSFYGTKPQPISQYKDVTFLMPMYNSNVEIDVKKLSGILKIDPKVVVKDCKR